MQPQSLTEHQKLLTEVIKKQIVILGPDITLAKARNVTGLTVADDGTVTSIQGNPQELTQKLVEQFMELSGLIVKKTMEPLLANYQENGKTNIQPPIPSVTIPINPMQTIQSSTTPTPNTTINTTNETNNNQVT